MGVLDGGKIQMPAPDKGRQTGQEAMACGHIARTGAGFDIGGTLPCATLGLVIGAGCGHRQADGRHRRIRPQPQVGAKDVAFGRVVGQKG